MDMSWMKELSGLAKKAKTKKGNKDLDKVTSYPGHLIRDGAEVEWRPFLFVIDKILDKSKKAMNIIEVDSRTLKPKKGAGPVYARIGTQPIRFIETRNLEGRVIYCESYAVTKVEKENQIFLWVIEDLKEREKVKRERDEQIREEARRLGLQRVREHRELRQPKKLQKVSISKTKLELERKRRKRSKRK